MFSGCRAGVVTISGGLVGGLFLLALELFPPLRVILGLRRPDQVESVLSAGSLTLGDTDVADLESATHTELSA